MDEVEISLNGHTFELDRSVPQLGDYIGEAGNLPPTIRKIEVTNKTLSEISVKVTSARAEGATYKYSIKKLEEADTAYEEKEDEGGETYTFTGLTSPETYTIKVDLVIKGEIKDSKTENVMLGELEEGAITFEGPIWPGNGTASAIVKTNTSYQLQYQINAIEDNGWQNISNGGTVTNIPAKESNLYARLWDGTNASDYATFPISDTAEPKITEIKEVEITETTIKVQVVAQDNESGIAKIEYSSNNGVEYTTGTSATATEYTFTGLTELTEYTIKVRVTDGAGNTAELSKKIATDGIQKWDGQSNDKVEAVVSDDEVTVPVPHGFVASKVTGEKTVSGGFVIYEGDTEVNDLNVDNEITSRNQFVWVPVGKYKTSAGEIKTNNLARRTFTSSGANEVIGDELIEPYMYGEGDKRSVASEMIETFKTSVSTYGGFYIGRYEQGIGNVCKAGVETYVNATRDEANMQAIAMYSENSYVKSELISSYAWDTALNFICQTNSEGYILATISSSSYGNMGTGNPTKTGEYREDKYSNICDFLGNKYEWTTEYYDSGGDTVFRGASCHESGYYAAVRVGGYNNRFKSNAVVFRTQMYIKL